jgi:hypothetical protein
LFSFFLFFSFFFFIFFIFINLSISLFVFVVCLSPQGSLGFITVLLTREAAPSVGYSFYSGGGGIFNLTSTVASALFSFFLFFFLFFFAPCF